MKPKDDLKENCDCWRCRFEMPEKEIRQQTAQEYEKRIAYLTDLNNKLRSALDIEKAYNKTQTREILNILKKKELEGHITYIGFELIKKEIEQKCLGDKKW